MCLSSAQSGRATENCLRTDTSCAAKIAALQRTAWHGVVSTSGCAGPVSQPLVTGMYQSVAHLDRVLSMQCAWWWWWLVWELPCRLVLFFLPLLWISFSFLKFFLIGSRISRSFVRLMSLSVCLSMYHPRTFFCKIMRVFGKSSDLSRVSARC